MWHDEQLWKEETRLLGWNNNKNYVMHILHQFKLMTSNGFGILLILVERIKRDIVQTSEGIDGTTVGIWKQRMNWYDNEGREILNEPPEELKMKVAKAQITGKNWKMNEDTWQNLDTREQRDRELTRVNLNDAPVRFGERELKAGMNNSEKMGSKESNWRDSWIALDGWKELS